MLRSMLFVPGDSERKLAKGAGSPADALILDLEDSVAAERTAIARGLVRDYLDAHPDRARTTALGAHQPVIDIAGFGGSGGGRGRPTGRDHPAKARLRRRCYAAGPLSERARGAGGRASRVLEDHPGGDRNGRSGVHTRQLCWLQRAAGRHDLGCGGFVSGAGASTNRAASGSYAFTYEMARSLCLAGAVAAEVQPLDTLYADFRDAAGLAADSRRAARPGSPGGWRSIRTR